jgi:hypothetical protein
MALQQKTTRKIGLSAAIRVNQNICGAPALDPDPLDLNDGGFIAEAAAVLEVRGDAGRAEGVMSFLRRDLGG